MNRLIKSDKFSGSGKRFCYNNKVNTFLYRINSNMMMMKRKPIQCRQGFTLVETLIAVFILSVGILISLMFFVRAQDSTQLAQDMTVATTHADSILEEIYGSESLTQITTTDWASWLKEQGLTPLPAEAITVEYGQPDQRPLPVSLTVRWKRQGRDHHVSLATELIK